MTNRPSNIEHESRPNLPVPSLSRNSSNSSLNTAAHSDWSSNPGGNNFIGANGLLSPPSTVPSTRSVGSVKDDSFPEHQPNSPVSAGGSSAGSDIAPNTTPLIKQATKALKPHSRTAIGRLTRHLESLPHLLVVDLTIQCKTQDNDRWETVKGRKIRDLVAREWLEMLPIEFSVKNLASVKIGAGVSGARVDARVAFRVDNAKHKQRIERNLKLSKNPRALQSTKKIEKGGKISHTVYYQAVVNDTDEAYQQSILRILQSASRQPDLLRDALTGAVDARLPSSVKQQSISKPLTFRLRLRTQISVDFKKSLINFDFDLVPCIKEMSACELLLGLLGTDQLNTSLVETNLSPLRYTLCGLRARCTYKPCPKSMEDRANVQLLEANDNSGREIQIQDVQLHSVPVSKTETNKMGVKVEDYFSNMALNRALPFVRDNTGAWIPFELLKFEDFQPLLSFGHQNEIIRAKARKFLKTDGLAYLQETSEKLIEACGTPNSSSSRDAQTWLNVSKPGSFTSTPSMMSCVRQSTIEKSDSRIGIVQIDSAENDLYALCLEEGLKHRYSIVGRKQLNASTLINHSSLVAIKNAQLILVVINASERSKIEIERTVALLHRTAELEIGIPVICTTSTHLQKKVHAFVKPLQYIPADLYAKIDCMLGQTYFDRSELRDHLQGGNVMIVGAHTAHWLPNNEDAKYHPSITAVVASKNPAGLQYAGSIRIQRATDTDTPNPNLAIEDLSGMMMELLEQWKVSDNQPPSRMILFRDSIAFDNPISRAEIRQLHFAFKTVFPNHTLQIAYVVVNKNTALSYSYTDSPNNSKAVPVADYLATGDSHAKHRYYVLHNEVQGLSTQQLADITGSLNSSSPLNPHGQTSTALSLLHARKLAKRVHTYLRFEDKLPTFKQEHPPGVREECEAEAVEKAKEVLGITEARQRPWSEELDGGMFFL